MACWPDSVRGGGGGEKVPWGCEQVMIGGERCSTVLFFHTSRHIVTLDGRLATSTRPWVFRSHIAALVW